MRIIFTSFTKHSTELLSNFQQHKIDTNSFIIYIYVCVCEQLKNIIWDSWYWKREERLKIEIENWPNEECRYRKLVIQWNSIQKLVPLTYHGFKIWNPMVWTFNRILTWTVRKSTSRSTLTNGISQNCFWSEAICDVITFLNFKYI